MSDPTGQRKRESPPQLRKIVREIVRDEMRREARRLDDWARREYPEEYAEVKAGG